MNKTYLLIVSLLTCITITTVICIQSKLLLVSNPSRNLMKVWVNVLHQPTFGMLWIWFWFLYFYVLSMQDVWVHRICNSWFDKQSLKMTVFRDVVLFSLVEINWSLDEMEAVSSSKIWSDSTRLYSATSQKTGIIILITMRTWNLTKFSLNKTGIDFRHVQC
jgi:hypothetical protein